MGLEDREWYREELRQKGHKASWDNFRAAKPGAGTAPLSADKTDPVADPGFHDESRLGRIRRILSKGEIHRLGSTQKQPTYPSYVHLQAQEILDARRTRGRGRFFLITVFLLAASIAGYALYPFAA